MRTGHAVPADGPDAGRSGSSGAGRDCRESRQPNWDRDSARGARRDRVVVRTVGSSADQRRGLPRPGLRGRARDQLRVADIARCRGGQQLFEVLRDDRLAVGLAARAPGTAARGGLPDGQFHDLPAGAGAGGCRCRVLTGIGRRGGCAPASLRGQQAVAARRAARDRHRSACPDRWCVLRLRRRVAPDHRLAVVLLEIVERHRRCDRPGHRLRHGARRVVRAAVVRRADERHRGSAAPHRILGAAMSVVTYELDDHVATITLNRPEARNAINGGLRRDLNAAWDRFRDDEDAWVAILTANGDVFCAGGDLKDGEGSVGTFGGTFWEKPTINSFESGMELFKPTIAAVHGPCIGYGLTGVLFCDFVIATTEAVFSFPEVSIGVPTIVGAIRLPHRVGWANAMELLLTGKPMNAERAKEIGLVWKLVDPEQLQAEAKAWARTLTEAAPLAQRATKEVAWRTVDMGWVESVRFGETDRKVVAATEDVTEGLRAWREKRKPRWRGR